MTIAATAIGRDARVIGLVGTAHFCSHFYIFVLPPLFPLLKGAFGIGYVELGLLVTVFNVASGVTQAPMGFLVDRFGAGRLLVCGLALEAAAFFAMGAFGSYAAMLGLVALAGVANSVYHPSDYAILNAAVRSERIGRAFSLHTFAGFLGNAATPALVITLALAVGWQNALMLAGTLGLLVAALLLANRDALGEAGSRRGGRGTTGGGGIRLLLSLPVLMCFLFFVALSMAASGLNSFAAVAFVQMYGIALADAGWLLTVFLTCNALGILVGGQIADRVQRHELVAMGGLAAAAVLISTIAYVAYDTAGLMVLLAVAGLLYGLIMPSRDMLVRAATPPDSMGKVFGFVSTGLNLGAAVTPAVMGLVMDLGRPHLLFVVAPGFMVLATLTALVTAQVRRRAPPAAQ